jgi:hypothetical protein
MKKTLYVLLALAAIVLAAFFFAPASLVSRALSEASGGQFALKNSDGSVWSGQGELAMNLPDGSITALPGVKWRVDPVAALGGRLVAELSGAAQGKIRTEGGLRVAEAVKMNVPASALVAAAIIGSLSPGGSVDVSIPSAKWGKDTGEGNGELVWSNASIQVPNAAQRVALGTVRVLGQLQGNVVNFTVSNDGGTVALTGGGQWPRGGAARYDVALSPRPGFPPDQLAALTTIAKPDSNGSYRIRLP